MSLMIIKPPVVEDTGGAHRYWRVRFTETEEPGYAVAIARLEMYETHWGPNVLSGGTPGSGGDIFGYGYGEAFDEDMNDNNGRVWAVDTPGFLKYDFGSGQEKEIQAIGLYVGYVGHLENDHAPTDFTVDFSDDGAAWTTSWAVVGYTWVSPYHRLARFPHPDFIEDSYTGSPHGAHEYWRVNTCRVNGSSYCSAAELQFKDEPSGTDQTSGGTAFADSWYLGPGDTTYAPDKAFDDITTTFWVNNGGDMTRIGYQFATDVECGEFVLRSRHDTQVDQTPKHLVVQYADGSGGPWTMAWEMYNQTGWVTNDERTFPDPNFI